MIELLIQWAQVPEVLEAHYHFSGSRTVIFIPRLWLVPLAELPGFATPVFVLCKVLLEDHPYQSCNLVSHVSINQLTCVHNTTCVCYYEWIWKCSLPLRLQCPYSPFKTKGGTC